MTALRLVSYLEKDSPLSEFDKLNWIELFRSGFQLGSLGYGVPLRPKNVMDLPSGERDEYLQAVVEDCEFFLSIDATDLEASFSQLPISVRYWFHRRIEEMSREFELDDLHVTCLRMFLSGIAFVDFSGRRLGRSNP